VVQDKDIEKTMIENVLKQFKVVEDMPVTGLTRPQKWKVTAFCPGQRPTRELFRLYIFELRSSPHLMIGLIILPECKSSNAWSKESVL